MIIIKVKHRYAQCLQQCENNKISRR